MKYLIKRNDFLREAKRLDEKSEFLRDSKISGNELYQQLVKEEWDSHGNTGSGSGPMANDIGWHDSLIGRFLNHLVRKAKIAANLVRIKPLIRRLEGEFDRIMAEAYVYKMNDEQKMLYIKSILYSFFWELREAVEKGEKVHIIINLTEYAIKNLENIKDEQLEDRIKEVMLKELELFLEFLKQFEEEEGNKEEDNKEEDEEEEDLYSNLESSLPIMIKNLNALYYILKNYEKVNLMTVSKSKQKDAQGEHSLPAYVTKGGETIESIQKNLEINKKKLSSEQIIGKNEIKLRPTFTKAAGKFPKEKTPLPKGLSLVLEKQGTGEDRNNIRTGEDHLTQAFTKLKGDIRALIDTKDGKLPITAEFVRILLEKHKDDGNKDLIMALYNNINRYLVGDKKQTIQEKDPLYKESYEYLMPISLKSPKGGKMEIVAEKIARFSKRALQFDGQNLYGGLGDLADPLKKFVETMKVLMKNPIVNTKSTKKEIVKSEEVSELKESLKMQIHAKRIELLNFDGFVSIKEADGQKEEDSKEVEKETSASDPRSGMSISEKIKDYFDKKCMTVKEFTMKKSEFKKVKENFEILQKDKDGFIIDGYDPIIEILKLFNRAYKLYMAKYITKRSTGPGASTAAEYTAYGSNGPFRNDKIFDVWENAVLDIMKQRKYQMIFDKKTKLRVGDELRPNGGAQLRKFMTDMLDGDKLYKIEGGGSDGRGAQARLLDSYFGPADEKTKEDLENKGTSFENDLKENEKVSEEVMKSSTKLKPVLIQNVKSEDGKKSDSPIVNTFLTIKALMGTDEVQRTFFIQKIEGGFVYMQYTKAFGAYLPYLEKVDGKKEILDGDIKFNTSTRTTIKYTKIPIDKFEILLSSGTTIEVATIDNDLKEESEKLKIKDSYLLSKNVDGNNIVFKADSGKVGTEEGRAKQLEEVISKTANKGIVTITNTRKNVVVKKYEENK